MYFLVGFVTSVILSLLATYIAHQNTPTVPIWRQALQIIPVTTFTFVLFQLLEPFRFKDLLPSVEEYTFGCIVLAGFGAFFAALLCPIDWERKKV